MFRGVYPGVELLDDAVSLCHLLRDHQTAFCSGHTVPVPPTVSEGSVSKHHHLLFHFLVITVLVGVASQTLTCRPRAPAARVTQAHTSSRAFGSTRSQEAALSMCVLEASHQGQPHSGGGAQGIQGHV